ncbi:hypothetical protein MtrunA17_Chr4g0045801 [Medicago truncatula]|uniref:Uncharacterized protein n=1 Tax=Medicago truncatula TaxID=3880 RepID=A0A396IBY8_MEDTR|nr:hypothetical protein MtrunA17_Chr4g0045801 [Medicago truncatula]
MGYCEKKLTNMARLTKIDKDFNYISRLWRNLYNIFPLETQKTSFTTRNRK